MILVACESWAHIRRIVKSEVEVLKLRGTSKQEICLALPIRDWLELWLFS